MPSGAPAPPHACGDLTPQCIRFLDDWEARPRPGRAIAVFDVDWTLVVTVDEARAEPGRAVRAASQISAARELHAALCKRGVPIFWISARADLPEIHEFTRRQLRDTGLPDPSGIFLCPEHLRGTPADIAGFKHEARRRAEREGGGRVLFAVGDQWGDLTRTAQPPAPGAIPWLATSEGATVAPGRCDGDIVLVKLNV